MEALSKIIERLGSPWGWLPGAGAGVALAIWLLATQEWGEPLLNNFPIASGAMFAAAAAGATVARVLSIAAKCSIKALKSLWRVLVAPLKPKWTRRKLRRLSVETITFLQGYLTGQADRELRASPRDEFEHCVDELNAKGLLDRNSWGALVFPLPPPKLTKVAWAEIRREPAIIGLSWAIVRGSGHERRCLVPNAEEHTEDLVRKLLYGYTLVRLISYEH